MTAFKKYCKSKGLPSNEDFPFLPYNGLEEIEYDAELCKVTFYHVSITEQLTLQQNGEFKQEWF